MTYHELLTIGGKRMRFKRDGLLACKRCGHVPEMEFDISVTRKYKFAKARILHFCGIETIQLAADGGFRKTDACVDDVPKRIAGTWNKINAG